MNKILIEIIDWYGVIAVLSAYFLVTYLIVSPQDSTYLILNLTGALAIVIHSYWKKDYQPFTLNVVWTLIATIALVKGIFL